MHSLGDTERHGARSLERKFKGATSRPITRTMVKRAVWLMQLLNAVIWIFAWAARQAPGAASDGVNPMAGFIVGALLILAYFAPSLVADSRKHKSAGGILVVNFFLGFTFLGWILALAWAYADTGRREPSVMAAE